MRTFRIAFNSIQRLIAFSRNNNNNNCHFFARVVRPTVLHIINTNRINIIGDTQYNIQYGHV